MHLHTLQIGGHSSGVATAKFKDGTLHLGGSHPGHGTHIPIKMGSRQLDTSHIPEPPTPATNERRNIIEYGALHDGKLLRVSQTGVSYTRLADSSADNDVMGYASATKPAADTYKHGLVRAGDANGTRFLSETGEWGLPSAHSGVVTSSLKQLQDFPSSFAGQSGKYLKVGGSYPSGLGVVYGDLATDIAGVQLPSVSANRVIISSDERLKDGIEDFNLEEAADMLRNINPVKFKYKGEDRLCYGVLAQQLRRVLPDAVIEGEHDGYLRVDYVQLTGLLLGSQKALLARLDALEKKVGDM